MRKLVYIFALFISIVSCNKKEEKETSCNHGDTTCIDGYIYWGGDPAVDGTGWNLRTADESNPTYYVLKGLANDFKTDGIAVKACIYETDERVVCFCPPDIIRYKYAIASIKKR